MRRWLLAIAIVAVLAVAVYELLLKDSGSTPAAKPKKVHPTAVIGSGNDAVAVGPRGELLSRVKVPADSSLPRLPLEAPPKQGRLGGTVLAQARVLGAAPPALRRYVERSYYGKSGVDILLDSGIELRFGDASEAPRKWKAAAAVLADPSITALDYVDLHSPDHPAVSGSGHTLPPAP